MLGSYLWRPRCTPTSNTVLSYLPEKVNKANHPQPLIPIHNPGLDHDISPQRSSYHIHFIHSPSGYDHDNKNNHDMYSCLGSETKIDLASCLLLCKCHAYILVGCIIAPSSLYLPTYCFCRSGNADTFLWLSR